MEVWPSNYLLHYVNEIDTIASGDPNTARDVLVTVLTFDVDSDDVILITEGVLTLTSTRRQDVDGLKYAVGRHMPAFITKAGINHATPVLASALQIRQLGLPDDVPSYPIRTPTVEGHVDVTHPERISRRPEQQYRCPHQPDPVFHDIAATRPVPLRRVDSERVTHEPIQQIVTGPAAGHIGKRPRRDAICPVCVRLTGSSTAPGNRH